MVYPFATHHNEEPTFHTNIYILFSINDTSVKLSVLCRISRSNFCSGKCKKYKPRIVIRLCSEGSKWLLVRCSRRFLARRHSLDYGEYQKASK